MPLHVAMTAAQTEGCRAVCYVRFWFHGLRDVCWPCTWVFGAPDVRSRGALPMSQLNTHSKCVAEPLNAWLNASCCTICMPAMHVCFASSHTQVYLLPWCCAMWPVSAWLCPAEHAAVQDAVGPCLEHQQHPAGELASAEGVPHCCTPGRPAVQQHQGQQVPQAAGDSPEATVSEHAWVDAAQHCSAAR